MLKADRQRFELILHNVLTYHPEARVAIDQKRDTRILQVDKHPVAMTSSEINKLGSTSKMQPFGLGLISAVKKSFSTYLRTHLDELVPNENGEYTFKAIPQLNSPIYTNRNLYDKIGIVEDFYIIDLAHAYWRIAYLKGYISEKLYTDHVDKDSKLYRNMALACTVAHTQRTYYANGEPKYEISEVCLPYETMYENIRHTCYNAVGDVQRELSQQVFAYRTDAVFVTKDGLERAKKMLYNRGFLCRVIRCTKINENNFVDEEDNMKKF
jgi:hypothetical protein